MSRVVVISGGGTGIGRATAESFAREGERIVLLGRRPEVLARTAKEINATTPDAAVSFHPADLTDPDQVGRVRDRIASEYGRVDVLVNNAGGNALRNGTVDTQELAGTARAWTANFEANVLTAVLLTESLRELLPPSGGRVVLIGSIAAYRPRASYGAAKAAVASYVVTLAEELGPAGTTVNVVAPGYIPDTEFFGTGLSEEAHQAMVAQTVTKRVGTPQDVAHTIRWLAAPESAHVTGQVIHVDGGAERAR